MPGLKSKIIKVIIKGAGSALFFCLASSHCFAQTELPISSATASSYFSPYIASNAIDNNYATIWRGGSTQTTNWWLRLDLGQSYPLSQISIWWSSSGGSTNYNIQASTDGTNWTDMLIGLSSAGGSTNPYKLTYNISGSARYIQLYIKSGQRYQPIIYEVKLYGEFQDTIPPTGTIKINNDATFTNSTSATLTLYAEDSVGGSGLSQMQFSNDNINWSALENYGTTKNWTLTSGEAIKTVYARFKDLAGNWSVTCSDTIVLDTTPPTGSIIINNGDASTDSLDVTLNLSAADSGSGMTPGAQMKFSNDNSNWSIIEPYASTKPWKLSIGLGTKTVYAKFQDAAGNWSGSISDTIELANPPGVSAERIYIYLNGKRIAMEENGRKYFFHSDHLGSTSLVTDESGQQVKYLEYKPFGDTKTEEGSLVVKKKFTGKEMDDSTGLYDYSARMYDAKIGRFISPDPLELDEDDIKAETGRTLQEFLANPQRLNRYSYCLNNPLKYIDPSGKDVVGIHGFIGQPEGIKEVLGTVSGAFPQLPSVFIDWRGGGIGFRIEGFIQASLKSTPAIKLIRATEKITAYQHQQLPRIYVGHSRGADAILEGIRTGKIPLDKNTRLILIGANKNIIKGALGNLAKVGNSLIVAKERDYVGGDRSYGGIMELENFPGNIKLLSTKVEHANMGRSKEVSALIKNNLDWLKQ